MEEDKMEKRTMDKLAKMAKNRYMIMGEFRWVFITCSLFRLLRLGGQALALSWAQQAFENRYVKDVHGEDSEDPPSLSHMLFLFLSIDSIIQLLVVIALAAVFSIYKERGNCFKIDHHLLSVMLKESIAISLFILTVGSIVAHYFKKKRYFAFKMQGGGTSRAYQDVLMGICVVATFIPFKYVFEQLGI